MKKKYNDLLQEIKDYFKKQKDEDYLAFDDHPLSSVEDLLDASKPAPWDHLTNTEDDHDLDVEIEEKFEK
tara:strand:+ start:235 stop:444 length:210 start_codon:yes stop_codon:yes gene_type:complete